MLLDTGLDSTSVEEGSGDTRFVFVGKLIKFVDQPLTRNLQKKQSEGIKPASNFTLSFTERFVQVIASQPRVKKFNEPVVSYRSRHKDFLGVSRFPPTSTLWARHTRRRTVTYFSHAYALLAHHAGRRLGSLPTE